MTEWEKWFKSWLRNVAQDENLRDVGKKYLKFGPIRDPKLHCHANWPKNEKIETNI
jgi:hypothetical protein